MNSATTRPRPFWTKRDLLGTAERGVRRKTRQRRNCLRQLESLEDRTLLNASIDIDAAALLTYHTDPAAVENLQVSVAGNVYTFASNQNIDITTNIPGLVVTNPGTPTVTVTGIAGLVVEENFTGDVLTVLSSNVPTAINLNSSAAVVTLGGPASANGLADLSSLVTVVGPGVGTTNSVTLDDSGSSAIGDYFVSPVAVTTSTGFGGLAYSGVSNLSLKGAGGGLSSNTYNVNGTADGVLTTIDGSQSADGNSFIVNATSSDPGAQLNLIGNAVGNGVNSTNVRNSTSGITIIGGTGPNSVVLGDAGLTSGVKGQVSLAELGGAPFAVTVSDAAGTTADAWKLMGQASPSTLATLTGFGSTGSLVYDPMQVISLQLFTAQGQANILTVDFSNGSPLPAAGIAPNLSYFSGGAGSGQGDLVLLGDPRSGPIDTETHVVTGLGQGAISFSNLAGSISYSDLAPTSVYDVLPATNYVFNDTADPSGQVLITGGINDPVLTGGAQTLLISSQASPPSFSNTNVANKTNINVNVDSTSTSTNVTVNYLVGAPVAGLEALTVTTGAGQDQAQLVNMPPGAYTILKQAGGDDHAYIYLRGASGATGTSLDGGPGNDVLTVDAGGLAVTPGNFSSGAPGYTTISGAPLTGGPIQYTSYEQVNVTNLSAASPVVTATTIHAVQGQSLDSVVVGTFTSTAPGAKASDFLATVQFGDGTQRAGTILQDASNPSVFYVLSSHTYYEDHPSLTTHVIVVSLGSSTTQIINGVPVTFTTPGTDPVTADGTAVVDNAPITVSAGSFSGFENITPSPADVFVASFVDHGGVNPDDPNPAGRYSVLIDWGDGSAPLPVLPSQIVRNGTSNSYTVTVPQHVYTTPGTYIVTVTVSDGGAQAVNSTATGVAYIADAPLTPSLIQPLIIPATEGALFQDEALATFDDANPLSKPGDFQVVIDWGDGSPMSYGRLTQPGGVGTTYYVVGSHTYADAMRAGAPPVAWGPGPIAGPLTAVGTFPIRIFVQDTYGSAVNLTSRMTVNDNPINVMGGLNPGSDSGASNSDGITNVAQPTIQGWTSEGGALVYVYATATGGSPVLIGRTTSDAAGAWSVTSTQALADGGYAIQAQTYDASGHSVSPLTTLTPALVIDTVGPKVTDLVFDSLGGQVLATFQDSGGVDNAGVGLNYATVVDANNYRFALIKSAPRGYRPPAQWIVGGVAVQPGGPVGPQVAAIKINDGRGIRGGRYLFTIRSVDPANLTGVQDIAGNALDGEFYSFFPSGNNVNGGDFVAELDAVHHTVYAPKTTIGTASPVSPPGRRGVNRYITRSARLTPRATLALRLSAARASVARPAPHSVG